MVRDLSTEEKILEAARNVFTQKGFAATRTRDIAQEAGINLALLNYYFRSKEKLFGIIMQENMARFFSAISVPLNKMELSLREKLEAVVDAYINMFMLHPDLPFFVLNEVRNRADDFVGAIGVKEILMHSHFFVQLQKEAGKSVNPLHYLMNLLAMTAFPFVASPMIRAVSGVSADDYKVMMLQRKKLIPLWMESLLNADYESIG